MEIGDIAVVMPRSSLEMAEGLSPKIPPKEVESTPPAADTAPSAGQRPPTPSPSPSPRVAGVPADGVEPPAVVHSSPESGAVVVSSGETSGKEDAAGEAAAAAAPVEALSDETKAALVKQAEFYFSDENLLTDAFMKKKIKAGGAQGWVPLKVICNFPKMKKLSKDIRAVALALAASDLLVVAKATRVRRKVPFKFPDKEGVSDVVARTVVAVNIPADSTVESLTHLFSACGVAEAIRVIHKGKTAAATGNSDKNSEIQAPIGPSRDFYATCQYSRLEEAIRAVNELTDRKSWRGGLRVSLANGITVEKALAKLKAAAGKKARADKKDRAKDVSNRRGGDGGSGNVRDGQTRSRSLTELELDNTAAVNGEGGAPVGAARGERGAPPNRQASREDESSSGDGTEGASTTVAGAARRKPRSVSNADALYSGGGGGGTENWSPPRHAIGSAGDGLPRKGVVQTLSSEGWSWIKKDGNGSRKSGNRIPFLIADVVTTVADGEPQPLQKGDYVEYRSWKDSEGRLMAVRVERVKERSRPAGGVGGGGGGNRATQSNFRMAAGPEEGSTGFAAGRGRPIAVADPPPAGGGAVLRRPRGSSMGGADSKVFVPSCPPPAAAAATAAAEVADPSSQQFEDAD